jgi:hypothetical protein
LGAIVPPTAELPATAAEAALGPGFEEEDITALPLLTAKEAKARLRVGVRVAYGRAARQEIGYDRVGKGRGSIRISEEAPAEYIAHATTDPRWADAEGAAAQEAQESAAAQAAPRRLILWRTPAAARMMATTKRPTYWR